MNTIRVGALCALVSLGIVAAPSLAQKESKATMHKACVKCAKAGKKQCACPMPKTGAMKLHKACAKCAKAGKKQCACPEKKASKPAVCADCAKAGKKECNCEQKESQ
jgi:hypothetical protein